MVKFYSKNKQLFARGGGKYFNKISSFIEKIGKQNFILIILVILILGITGLYQTFSLFTSSEGVSVLDGIKTLKFVLGSDNTENSVIIASGSSKNIAVTVSNHDKINLKYGVYYSSTDDLTNVELGYLSYSEYPGTGVISSNTDYLITVKVYNNSSTDITIQFGVTYGVENGGDLILESNQKLLDIIYPYKYEVEYLESNGTQYIDTNFYPNQDTSIEFVAETLNTDDTLFWFGGRNFAGSTNGNSLSFLQIGNKFRSDYHNTLSTISALTPSYDTKYKIYLNKNITKINDTEYVQATYANFSSPSTLSLFGVKTYTSNLPYSAADDIDYRRGILKLYSCKIWDNETLIRDYIPVIDREGIPCLYDKVNNEFYYNMDAEGVDFATNYTPYEVKVEKNFNLTTETLRTINSIPEDAEITDLSIKDSSGTIIESTLENYDIYTVSYKMNSRNITESFIPVPSTSITLTNALSNAGFESELTNYYNASPLRSTSVKRSGSYSMYYTCDNNQTFLRIKYGDIGAKDHDVYVRVYSMTDNSSLGPLLYVHEDETFGDWCNNAERYSRWFTKGSTYNKWAMWSQVTNPTSENYSYFTLQISQGNTTGVGNVYWDDFMAIVLGSEWDSIPTTAWMDKMIPDFTGTQTFSW